MSVYKELNEVKLDLEDLQEIPLTQSEERRILTHTHGQIHPKKQNKKWLSIGLAAVAVCLLSLSLNIEKGTIAGMPFIGEPIEKYLNQNAPADYTSYKTAIGETAENELGRLTLNEVMMDNQHLLLSATFEPADGVAFDYQTHIQPTVKINGQDVTGMTGGQSIELNTSMFTIYNDIELNQVITTEELSIQISYDTWNFEKTIEQPWLFDVKVSQKTLLAKVTEFEMNQEITLKNGEKITLQKVVATPISTTVYYDLSQSESEDIHFDIETAEGAVEAYRTQGFNSNEPGDTSFIRFEGLAFGDADYFLVVRSMEGNVLSDPVAIK